MNLSKKITRFLNDESGPTAVEYAVMLALIILAAIASIGFLGQATNSTFSNTTSAISAATQ